MDLYLLLTPILLLAVIAVLGFVGCSFQPGSASSSDGITPSRGPTTGGTNVTITGDDFGSNPVVQFGISPDPQATAPTATITSVTTISAVTPPYPSAKAVYAIVSYKDSNGNLLSERTEQFTYVPPVTHVGQTVLGSGSGPTIKAPTVTLNGGELLVVSLLWGVPSGGSQAPPVLSVAEPGTGINLQPVPSGAPFSWASHNVQTFVSFNNAAGPVTISARLPQASPIQCKLTVSAYDNVDSSNPTYGAVAIPDEFHGNNPMAPPITGNAGDMIYAIAFAADSNGLFPGNNPLTPGTGFTGESGAATNPIVEDQVVPLDGSMITAQVANTTTLTNPRGWIFAMGIKLA